MMMDTATATPISIVGNVRLKTKTTKGFCNETDVFFLVASNVQEAVLIAWHDLIELGVIGADFPVASRPTADNMATCRAMRARASLHSIMEEYSDVVSDKLKSEPMRGPPMKIVLKAGAIPRRVNIARQVPLRFREEFQKVISDLEDKKIIEKLGDSEPTEWCSHGFAVPKTPPKVRLVTDYQPLNKWVERPIHPFPAVKDIIRCIPASARVFAKMDAVHGYFQLALDEESSKLTTFLLETGRYKYLRAPMGLSASSDEWCKRSDELVIGLSYAKKIVDDIIVWADSDAELWPRIRTILDRCRHWNITVSKSKFEVGDRILFAGCVITADGIYPDPAKTKAIREFPEPKNITDLRSFLGLSQQLGHYHPDLAHMQAPLRELLKADVAWQWLPQHAEAMEKVKKALVSSTVLKPFDTDLDTILLTDASRLNGIGWALMQIQPENHRLILCGSRGLTDTQKRYCTTSLEAMAIYAGIRKCDFYLRGLPYFKVITDHKALVSMFKQDLEEVAIERVQRYRERLSQYCFEVEWMEGKKHLVADALSRYPAFDPEEDQEEEQDIAICRQMIIDPALDSVTDAADLDEDYKATIKLLLSDGDPNSKGGNHPAKELAAHWKELSVVRLNETDLLAKDESRIVVPREARKAVLQRIHSNHAGMTKSKALARQVYYWPNMAKDIEDMVARCSTCQALGPSMAAAASIEREDDSIPGSHYGVDLCHFEGQDWVVLMDRYSGYPFAKRLNKTNTAAVCGFLTDTFTEVGWPSVIRSDNGPQFRGEFKAFCAENNILHETSAPYNPQSNGLAESGVKIVKNILKECARDGAPGEFRKRLQMFRSEPRQDGYSPSQRFMGRNQRTELPCLQQFLMPISIEEAQEAKDKKADDKERARERQDLHARRSTQIMKGQEVLVQDQESAEWTIEGTILDARPDQQSFVIRTSDGKDITRNIKHVKPHLKPQAGGPHHPRSPDPELDRGHQRSTPDSEARRPEVQGPAGGGEEGARRSSRLAGRERPNYAEVVRGRVQQVRWLPSTHTSSTSRSRDSRSSTPNWRPTGSRSRSGSRIWRRSGSTYNSKLQKLRSTLRQTTGRSGRWWESSPRCQSWQPWHSACASCARQTGKSRRPRRTASGRTSGPSYRTALCKLARGHATSRGRRHQGRGSGPATPEGPAAAQPPRRRKARSGQWSASPRCCPTPKADLLDVRGAGTHPESLLGPSAQGRGAAAPLTGGPEKETEKNATVRRKGGDPEEEKGGK